MQVKKTYIYLKSNLGHEYETNKHCIFIIAYSRRIDLIVTLIFKLATIDLCMQ